MAMFIKNRKHRAAVAKTGGRQHPAVHCSERKKVRTRYRTRAVKKEGRKENNKKKRKIQLV